MISIKVTFLKIGLLSVTYLAKSGHLLVSFLKILGLQNFWEHCTWHDGRYLTRSGLAAVLAKIKPQHITSMSSHSFRIGAATTAAASGYPRWLIQALGRWSSNCYRDYIRIPHTTLQNVSTSLANNNNTPLTPFDPDNIS